jgi:hypothetical protein
MPLGDRGDGSKVEGVEDGLSKLNEVLDRIEAQDAGLHTIPDDIPLMEIADRVVRGKLKLSREQMRLLIELLPYHAPKLMAVANVTEGSFAKLLDAAIARSQPKLIELHAEAPIEPEPTEHSASELKGPMSQLRKY